MAEEERAHRAAGKRPESSIRLLQLEDGADRQTTNASMRDSHSWVSEQHVNEKLSICDESL